MKSLPGPFCLAAALVFFLAAPSCNAASAAATSDASLPPPFVNENVWRPAPNVTWQWQLTTPVDLAVDAEVFNIDLFDNRATVVSKLKKKGRKVICYVSAGSWEAWRPDASRFPGVVLGKDYEGWPKERWLDIRRIDLLAPIMLARLDLCRAKGFDGIELDNVDGYTNDTGFTLTANDQLRYNAWLANEARSRGLSVGLKNNAEQISELVPYFDWVLVESCFAQGWCAAVTPFIVQGKAAFAAEYSDAASGVDQLCIEAQALQLSVVWKKRELDAFRKDCRAGTNATRRNISSRR